MRGSHSLICFSFPSCGSIPAGAGEPANRACNMPVSGVYPRGCGGAKMKRGDLDKMSGLSPRVRGSPLRGLREPSGPGSIPAGAGEPAWRLPSRHRRGVYPRGCGGAPSCFPPRPSDWGLSPRVRGSPYKHNPIRWLHGSIPAGAGEPTLRERAPNLSWVYPRGCGGANSAAT